MRLHWYPAWYSLTAVAVEDVRTMLPLSINHGIGMCQFLNGKVQCGRKAEIFKHGLLIGEPTLAPNEFTYGRELFLRDKVRLDYLLYFARTVCSPGTFTPVDPR